MLLTEPPPSPGDLHFRVLGIPVRVSPLFWLSTLILGFNPKGGTPPAALVLWIAVVFVSILVHELGHALTQRRFGGHPWITLHAVGGLASCDDCDRRPLSQILILLAGPAAGFAFAALIVVLVRLSGHNMVWSRSGEFGMPFLGGMVSWDPFESKHANLLLWDLLHVNILWGLVNLLPVYPLDGGQISRELCTLRRPRHGIVLSLRISVITGVAMALVGLLVWNSLFVALMFGYLAYESFRTLQSYQQSSPW